MNVGLVAAAISGLATSLGALPFVCVRSIPRRAYDGILGLGAGLMLAAATMGLLSEAVHDVRVDGALDLGRLSLVVAGFAVGVGIAAVMDRFIPHQHAGGHHQHLGHEPGHDVHDRHDEPAPGDARRGYAIVGALTLHRVPEGLAIGAGFAVPGSSHLGLLLAIAVGIQNVCEGLVMAAPLRQGGVSGGAGLLIVATTGLTIPAAAVVGGALAGIAAPAMPFILALAGGTLIYITSNEIIPESHSHGHEGTASTGVVFGFLLTMVLQAILR
ncbi:MAG TPA: ZIP family metal transporter [Polyangia bacterium]|nr:ZIP family metal transporter [Polyangia bacterium]